MIFHQTNRNSVLFYAVSIVAVLVFTFLNQKWNSLFQRPSDHYELIKQYLLTDSPLEGFYRPKLWIHTKFELNARQWESFMSRTSTELNQPYLELFIKSIINHCADDFHVCLIDDQSFAKLLPHWTVDMEKANDMEKTFYRHFGIAELVYLYGGLSMPNSTLALKSWMDLYQEFTSEDKIMLGEGPSAFRCLGAARKNHPLLEKYLEYLKLQSQEMQRFPESQFWNQHLDHIHVVPGNRLGQRNKRGEPLLLDHWMEEDFLNIDPACSAICINADELIKRTKYQWYAVLPVEELLKTSCILTKYLQASLVDCKK